MKKIAVAAMLAGGVALNAPAFAGEAEDIARAESVLAILETAKAAQTRRTSEPSPHSPQSKAAKAARARLK